MSASACVRFLIHARVAYLPARSMSDRYLTDDVIGVIMLCADVRTAVSLASTCHSISLPPLSQWQVTVDDGEMQSGMVVTSSRSMLRADPPILHGETIIAYVLVPNPIRIMYDRGIIQ